MCTCNFSHSTTPPHSLNSKLVPQKTDLPNTMATSQTPASKFRLGEDMLSDSSDNDQSAHSAASPTSPSAAKKSKTKKKKQRREVGALTDELDVLLGAAFQKPNGDAGTNVAAAGKLTCQEGVCMRLYASRESLPKRKDAD